MGESVLSGVDPARLQSLRFFNLFRLIIAGIFLVGGRELNLGSEHPTIFLVTAICYLGAVLTLGFPDAARRMGFDRLVTLQVVIDVFMLTAFMWSSGGFRSGMPVLMMIVLAGAGLVAEGRMVLFLAALTTLAVLTENGWRFIADGTPGDFLQVGITCIAFFGIALVARLLALRAKNNASLAERRGKELVKQQAVNERIIRDMRDGVIVLGPDGFVRQANPQAAALLGLQSMDGLALADIDPAFGDCRAQCGGADGRLMRLGPARRLLRCRVMEADSEAATGGDVLIYLTDFEDIQRQMQQLKLAALGRLTASMAHEIRNPLSAVTQAAELLQEEKRADMQGRLARIINDNAQRIERMIRDVLALGRRQQAQPEALPLARFVTEVVDAQGLRDGAERAIFSVEIDPELTLAIDRAHLHQILDNLLGNARRYCSAQPGSVRIRADVGADDCVRLHVQDDGPGLDKNTRAHLFEPFFTTHAKGTGLGLYIARELADANDAILELVSDSTGAHFVLTGRSCP
ncbi:MAG: PAS domain-containing sensor histidine kinase [Betaproteobacteria bacterium HGW-Betaproteobacteria-13]|uniref:histidine kinase n=1 Tax=Parazoarcus communis TaxID=41977 RepID=A0A2U8H0X9_9RHOO|nr:ATP-binding protein [Parazoarcus communis]AWI78365.1 PAS domain-containing sensor histidine kinase [Parazoarcus communis]PKO59111.1 MAG: PAS domain-containing sensor histidine kinase [Betaproteobacteria bacterium HGW-Betaproteobacteria-19]PKO81582.1 MAG: PAS domain-containing sensor histidine kinase [Betaproteobacteria bacterium HGW-Betaproteobacteria-13]